jgi:hypothetical protein
LSADLTAASELVRKRGAQVEARLEDIRPDLERADPTEIERDAALLADIEHQLRDATDAATSADERLRHLLRALETKRQLEAAGQAAETLLARRTELIAAVKRLEAELEAKETEAEAAEQAFSAEGDTQRKLADAERLLRHRRSRLANLQRDARRLATQLHIDMLAGDVGRALAECGKRLAELRARHRVLDSTALVRDLIDAMIVPLEAARREAGDQILVRTEEGGLTVSQTSTGVARRRREIADQPQPAQLRDVASQIDAEKRRESVLRDLAANLDLLEQQQRRVVQAEEEAAAAALQAEHASEAARLSREANQAVGAGQQTLTKVHAELASVQQQIGATGATSKEDAEGDLRAALDELGLTEIQLADAEDAARKSSAEADTKVAELTNSASAIRRRLTVHQTDIDLVIERLRENHRYRWLFQATPDLEASLADPERRYDTFEILRAAVLRAGESAYESAEFLSSLVGIAEGFFANDTSRPGDRRDLVQVLRPAFEAVLGERLRHALNSPSIRQAIFDGAEVVRVDAGKRQLTLRDTQDIESQRPMEAFSSGERAFAFTQARIADLDPSDKPNRLLVLDEFGAYVAADRLPELASFLAGEIEGGVADQVVVILPLHVDYASEIGDTRGELRSRYEDRLAQIRERGYCAVKLA